MTDNTDRRCQVSHATGYVPGEHAGDIHRYQSLTSTGVWWLCDADAASAPSRNVWVERIADKDAA